MSFEPGTLFAGDYRVVKPLNQGGMGAVYVVQQLSTGKMRALKLMNSSIVFDPASRAKFEQEARIGSRIASEHVVEVVAAGVDPQARIPYLVMELLEGEDMATRLKRGAFEPTEAALVLEQIAHALGAAHDAGVVHRDLKPENVFLGVSKRSNATQIVKLLDFGIAKVTEENQRNNTTAAYGTPMWLAPEQTRRGEITPAADVWAFGLLAFTMLTGHAFWRHAEGPQASLPSLIQDITTEPIPHASSRALEFAMHVPPGFDAWLETTLQRDPRMRFPNARAAWQALAPILQTAAPVELAPAQKRSSSLLVVLVIAVVMLTLAIAGATVAIVMTRSHEAAPVASVAPTSPTASFALASSPSSSATPDVASITPSATASAPMIATSSSPASWTEFRIGGGVVGSPQPLVDDGVHKFNGDLARDFDKCLPPTGPETQNANIVVVVSPDGKVKAAQPMYAAHAGPVLQCLIDALTREHFAATKTGGQLIFTLSWKHG